MLAFSKEEYQDRLRKVKERMAEQGIDLLLVSDPANICYISGYDAWSWYVHQLLVVPMDEDMPYLVLRGSDVPGIRHTTWLDDDHAWGFPDLYVDNAFGDHVMDFASDLINQHGFADNKVVAVEKDCQQFTGACLEHLVKGLPNAKAIVDSKLLVNWVKVVKSDAEVEAVRVAAKITQKIFETVFETVHPGVRQCDVAAAVYAVGARGVDDYAGEYAAMFPFMACGERSDACHLAWTNEPYKEGEVLMFEWSGVHKRYHMPTCRTIAIGEPKYQSMYDTTQIVTEALTAALGAAKPGNLVEDVPLAADKVYEKYGVPTEGHVRMGYSVGLNYPPNWAEHTISLRKGDKTVLQKNMTFHLRSDNWGIVLDPTEEPYGIHFSEGIVITDKGAEPLTNLPRELHIAR